MLTVRKTLYKTTYYFHCAVLTLYKISYYFHCAVCVCSPPLSVSVKHRVEVIKAQTHAEGGEVNAL